MNILLEVSKIGFIGRVKALYKGEPYDPDTIGGAIPVSEWAELYDKQNDTHLRQSALDTVVGKIIASMVSVKFKTHDQKLNYTLNVKSNKNMSATAFKTKLVKQMLLEGEALVLNINNQFYVADSFHCNKEKEMSEYTYEQIVINNFSMYKTYRSSEVFHFKYHNEDLKMFIGQLNESYARLFDRLIDVHMREQQIRLFANFKFLRSSSKTQQEQFDEFQNYLAGVKSQVEKESVAILPKQEDYELDERSQSFLGRSVTELGDLENMYVKQVANALQVPPLLFSGDLADISQHKDSFITYCIKPLADIITTEINAKYFSYKDFNDKKQLKYNLIPLLYNSELEMAKDIKTAMESGNWTMNHINDLLDRDIEETELANKRFITRNMAPLREDGTMQINDIPISNEGGE